MTKFVVIASGKGGVGKTTTSINLANALQAHGKQAIVVDADLLNPNVSLILGSDKVETTLHNVLRGDAVIDQIIYSHPSGIRVVPSSISLSDLPYSDYSALGNALSQLRGKADVVIVDSHPGINSDTHHLYKLADEVLVVTTPEISAVTDALKTIRMAEKSGSSVMGVLINRVEGKSYEMKLEDIESFLEKPVLSLIPEDSKVKQAAVENHPVYSLYPKSAASARYHKLAANLLGIEAQPQGFFRELLNIFGIR